MEEISDMILERKARRLDGRGTSHLVLAETGYIIESRAMLHLGPVEEGMFEGELVKVRRILSGSGRYVQVGAYLLEGELDGTLPEPELSPRTFK